MILTDMRAAHALLEARLPEKFRGRLKGYTAKDVSRFLEEVAAEAPESFPQISKVIGDVGRLATWRQGDTITLDDLKTPFDKKKLLGEMDDEIAKLEKSDLSPEKKKSERTAIWLRYNERLQEETTRGARSAWNTPMAG